MLEEEALPLARTLEFRKSMLPEARVSFAIPLVPIGDSIVEHMCFDILEQEHGITHRVALTRLPGVDAWASIAIFKQGETSSSEQSPNLSCSCMTSETEIDTVQGALDSWLSLLMHEKCNEVPELAALDQEDSQSEPELEEMDKVCEKVNKRKPRKGKQQKPMRLELRNGSDSNLGTIEADGVGVYVYHYGEVVLEIDARLDEQTVAVSKDGKKCAIATGLKWHCSLQPASQEQADFLQVDAILDPEASDLTMAVLMCVLAPIAFKLQAPFKDEV